MDLLLNDAAAVARSGAVDKILQAACRLTGMGFAAVARVTADRWLACVVRDEIAFGLEPGGELDVLSTLCHEVGACGRTIVIDHVAEDPVYRDHHTPKQYGFQSYISTPILRNGEFFGTLCAIDPEPARPSDPAITATFELFAELIGRHLEADTSLARSAALIELGDRFRDIEDSAELSFVAAEILGRTLDVDRSGYATVDAATETATIERDWTAPGVPSIAGIHRFRHYGSFIEDLKRGEPVIFADAEVDPRTASHARAMTEITARAIVNLPVVEHGDLAALLFLHSAAPRRWTVDELAFARDVADRTRGAIERRRAERALKHLNETLEQQVADRTAELRRYHDIIEATAAPICAFDTDYRLIAFNQAHNDEFRRVNGFDTKIGDVFPDLFIPEQRSVMRALMTRALSGEHFTVVEEFGRPELGTPCWEISYTPLRDEEGRIIGAFHHARDISDRLMAEAELATAQDALRQSQKLEAMGSLTGGVAHDLNNLLTPVMASLDLLQRKGLGGERERRLIDGALQSTERARTVVQRLLAFARRQPLQPRPVDVGALVAGMADLIVSTSGPQIKVLVDVADDLPAALADAHQVEMALLNLSVNARDAMPEGGRLTIAARTEDVAAGHRAALMPGRYVCLSVADTGTGMDADTLKRAVEPFYSTKGVGKGTGLGLSMAHGLAAQLGGALSISSTPGLGTDVELWLPATEARIEWQARIDDATTCPAVGTALLVDDEDLVRASTADMLADIGYAVVEAASAEEALRLIEGGVRCDLLITDHLMPGMTGTELARAVRRLFPSTRALIVSGYAEAAGVAPELPRLTKPFRQAELAATLAGLAEARG